jgi:phosphatidylglycerol---prolipoprotein diacylglyceryl transferase
MEFLFIKWNINPEIFRIGGFAIRYYSLMFAAAFYFSYRILSEIYKRENVSIFFLNKLLVFVVLGTLIGARLGQVFFYEFGYYKNHLLEIILPFSIHQGNFQWTGYQGLASHGGALGILIALAWYCKKYKQPFLWVIDRLVIVVALSGFFIRIGNLFNSEIIGKPTNLPWAFIFERVDFITRHPTQIYEALCYLIIFFILWNIYKKRGMELKRGFLFGLFLILVFSVRFIIEFLKENQEVFENTLPINMGQILSVPFILVGLYFVFRKNTKHFVGKTIV